MKTLRLIRNTQVILTIALTLSMQAAGFADITASGGSVVATTQNHISAAQAHLHEEAKAVHSGLEAFDNSKLGNRMPLVLVHGIGSYENDSFHWENFLSYAEKKADFQAKYKIYLYHYDSTRSVPSISQDMQTKLKGFIGALNGRNIKILAYSEGGLLTRNALQDAYLDAHTTEVLAIATPFHGSPLANPHWIQQQVKTENAFNPVRIGQRIAYKITGHKYPTFAQDFHWDNFDGAIPAADYLKNNGPSVQTSYALAKKTNFITYGSYFGTEVDPGIIQKELGLLVPQPKDRPQFSNLFRRNFLFSMVRNNIGRLPLANLHNKTPEPVLQPAEASKSETSKAIQPNAKAATLVLTAKLKAAIPQGPLTLANQSLPLGLAGLSTQVAQAVSGNIEIDKEIQPKPATFEPVSMMMFNDGISPISSTLWLGRFTQPVNGASIPVEKLWTALKSLKGSGQARLFSGLDHRNWMDGTTRTGQEQITDLLNPKEPPRTVFEWIVYDLMS